jgi:hypothetical protein
MQQRGHSYKILQDGYYWPTLHKDAQHYTSHCDECQRMGNLQREMKFPYSPRSHWNLLTSGVWTL